MKYFTTKELSKILGYNDDSYIRKLIISGKLKADKIGRQWMVSEESVHEYNTRTKIRDKFKRLISFNYELRSQISDAIDSPRNLTGPKDAIVAFSVGKAFKTQGAILTLCESGFGEDATALVRTLFEIMVNTAYIRQDSTDERAYRYLAYDWILRKKMLEYATKKPEIVKVIEERGNGEDTKKIIEEVLLQSKQVQDKYKYKNNKWSADDTARMAELVGKSDAYNTIYRLECQFSHSLVRVMNEYTKDSNENGIVFNIGVTENWVEENLVATFDFMSNIYENFCNQFGVKNDDLKTVVDNYLDFMKER